VTLRPDKLSDILEETERLLLDHNDDPFLLTGSERAAIVAFEQVATTAVEDGTPVVVNAILSDILRENMLLDSADLVGGAWPLTPEVARWVASNPLDCTSDFDGICRCSFDPADH
jgi:hypothetical protein